jgi:mono/diheme cytochrome c family protein
MMTRISRASLTLSGRRAKRGAITAALVATLATAASSACDTYEPSPSEESDAGNRLGPAGTGLVTGLPCDVQAIIENRCIACHDGSDTPPKLLDYDDLVASSTKDPAKARVVIAVELMKGNAMPPRPAAQPEPDEIASFETWIMNGAPRNSEACTDPPPPSPRPPGDGGVAATCTSGTMWTMGSQGSPLMHPGAACNACHQVEGGPNLRFAGTVYPSLHEVDACNGVAPPPQLTVSITDARGRVFDMNVNEAGNFFLRSLTGGPPPRPPFKARVTDGTKTREMNGSVTSGDCNSCHTRAGANGAPGRILAP